AWPWSCRMTPRGCGNTRHAPGITPRWSVIERPRSALPARATSGPRSAGATQRGPRPPGSVVGGETNSATRQTPGGARCDPTQARGVGKFTPAGRANGHRLAHQPQSKDNSELLISPAPGANRPRAFWVPPGPQPPEHTSRRVAHGCQQRRGRRATAPRSAAHETLRLPCVRVPAGRCAAMSAPELARAEPGEPYGIVAIAASAGGGRPPWRETVGGATGLSATACVLQQPE